MNENFWQVLRLGLPMLWFVLSAMALVALWTDNRKSQQKKIMWTAVICLLPLLGVGIFLLFGYR